LKPKNPSSWAFKKYLGLTPPPQKKKNSLAGAFFKNWVSKRCLAVVTDVQKKHQ